MRKLIYLLIFQIIIVFPTVAQQSVGNARIDKVYLIFKTHLDVGFTELGSKVVDTYNHEFIPAALKLSETFAANDTLKNHYPWTTGSWLIWNYLQSAGESERQRMIAAIERKDFFGMPCHSLCKPNCVIAHSYQLRWLYLNSLTDSLIEKLVRQK